MKLYRSAMTDVISEFPAGTVADEKRLMVACGDGRCIELKEIQLEGSKRMKTEDFLRGRKIEKGTRLGK